MNECSPRCLPCTWGAIPLVCADVEKAIRADQERLDRRKLARAVENAVAAKHVETLHRALKGNPEARKAAGFLTHALITVMQEANE